MNRLPANASRLLRERRALPCPACGVMCSSTDWHEIGSCWKCGELLPREDDQEWSGAYSGGENEVEGY